MASTFIATTKWLRITVYSWSSKEKPINKFSSWFRATHFLKVSIPTWWNYCWNLHFLILSNWFSELQLTSNSLGKLIIQEKDTDEVNSKFWQRRTPVVRHFNKLCSYWTSLFEWQSTQSSIKLSIRFCLYSSLGKCD